MLIERAKQKLISECVECRGIILTSASSSKTDLTFEAQRKAIQDKATFVFNDEEYKFEKNHINPLNPLGLVGFAKYSHNNCAYIYKIALGGTEADLFRTILLTASPIVLGAIVNRVSHKELKDIVDNIHDDDLINHASQYHNIIRHDDNISLIGFNNHGIVETNAPSLVDTDAIAEEWYNTLKASSYTETRNASRNFHVDSMGANSIYLHTIHKPNFVTMNFPLVEIPYFNSNNENMVLRAYVYMRGVSTKRSIYTLDDKCFYDIIPPDMWIVKNFGNLSHSYYYNAAFIKI